MSVFRCVYSLGDSDVGLLIALL